MKFYLVDGAGRQHLAVTGFETGDAQCSYKTQPEFHEAYGDMDSQDPSRKDVIIWWEINMMFCQQSSLHVH